MTEQEKDHSQTVLKFLKEWQAWAEAGAPPHAHFSRHYGLCSNLQQWADHTSWAPLWLKYILDLLFEKDGLDPDHPFGIESYISRKETASQHLCPKRLAWVRRTIAKLEQELDAP